MSVQSLSTEESKEVRLDAKILRPALLGIGLSSAVINVLYLTGSFFMLEVYDRILPARSTSSLVALSALAVGLYVYQGALEIIRGRILVRVSAMVDQILSPHVYRVLMLAPIRAGSGFDGTQSLRDFDQIKGYLSSAGLAALFDLPWLPFYLVICFVFHPLIGYLALAGGLVLILLTAATHYMTRAAVKSTSEITGKRNAFAYNSQKNAEVVYAMGMLGRLNSVWQDRSRELRQRSTSAADITYFFAISAKVFRTVLQSGVLAVGAVLVINNEASGGIIIASSILTARALAPIEAATANWRALTAARQSWSRLKQHLSIFPYEKTPLILDEPRLSLSVERLTACPVAGNNFALMDVNFSVNAGSAVGIIGPSASGKSSLARVILGIWPAVRGSVRLDGAALSQWDSEILGKHVGYLPQDVQLFAGTIAENISRFDSDAKPEDVIAAARAAGVHDLILRLSDGYQTYIGEGGGVLSAGQRQRLALARALFGDPFLVVLDEPNSNLDAEGEKALAIAIEGVRARQGIAIIIAHRPTALASVDLVLMLQNGHMQAFGARDEVLAKVLQIGGRARVAPLKVVGEVGETSE